MAKGFFLYGSSPDALANQQFGYDQFFTRTAEGNRAAMADAERFNIQAFMQAQAADEAARERDSVMRANLFQNDMARRAAEQQTAFARSLDARNFAANQAQAKSQADFREREFAFRKTLADEAKADQSQAIGHELAARAASQGLIFSPDDAVKKFKLPPDVASLYFEQSKDVQKAVDAQDSELSSAAKIMTAFTKAQRKIDEINARPVDENNPMDVQNRAKVIAQATQVRDLLKPRVDYLQNVRRQDILNAIEVDPKTGDYTPIIPQRPWRSGKTSGTGSTGGGSAFFNQSGARSTPAAPNDLSKFEGKVIVQNGVSFTVKNGVAVPL